MLRRALLPVIILAVAIGGAAVLIATRPKATVVKAQERAWPVSVLRAEPATRSPILTLYGRVESLWSSQLTAGIAADVLEVSVIEGDAVARGDTLVTLDDRDARLLLAQREAELREAEARIASETGRHAADLEALPRERKLLELVQAELDRAEDLVRKKAGAQSALDVARQAVERQAIVVTQREQALTDHAARAAELDAKRAKAEALRDQARLELERTRVTAPFNGRIARVLVSPGKRVRVGDALVQLYDRDALVVRAQLPTRYVAEVRTAQAADREIRVKGSLDDRPLTAVLQQLAGEVSGATGGVEALFRIEGAQEILQGRFVRLDLRLPQEPDLIALPSEAIYGTDRVYLVDDQSRLQAVRVERVGAARGAWGASLVLVRSSEIKPGDTIATTQLPNAVGGLLVHVAGSAVATTGSPEAGASAE